MINRENPRQLEIEEFKLPFAGELNKENRWVKLAKGLPWEVLVEVYHKALSADAGRPALRARLVIGALIIKHMLRLSDEETIEQIRENPYLQYFVGYSCYRYDHGFAPSLFVEIRKRLGKDKLDMMNEMFTDHTKRVEEKKPSGKKREEGVDTPDGGNLTHHGKLLIDATVAPSDITYPTDLELLNQARKESEHLIDKLYEPSVDKVKPRTYRKKARKAYLTLAKQRNKSGKKVRRGIKQQLGYVARNIRTIDNLLDEKNQEAFPLPYKDQRRLWIIREVYRQQHEMYRTKTHRIDGRIVSISQPHIRPIVRGKSGAKVEFGPKISASVVDGNVFLDRIGWEAYNEGLDLPMQVMNYYERFGCYPEVVISDKIYANRENRRYLKNLGIRYSGKSLGRPPKESPPYNVKKQQQKEARIRNEIEGVFGVGKRRFGLGLVMAKLKETSESWIAMVIFVMNISHWLRNIFGSLTNSFINALFFLFDDYFAVSP